ENREVIGLLVAPDRVAATSLEARRLGGAAPQRIAADLVVDATGRGSRAGAWLAALGYAPPGESIVRVAISYTSRLYRRTGLCEGDQAKAVLVYPATERRMGVGSPSRASAGS